MDNLRSIKDDIKNSHFSYYEKMGWKHSPTCICHQWEKGSPTEAPTDELKAIEEMSFAKDEILPENLPF